MSDLGRSLICFIPLVLQGVLCPTGCELKTTLLKQERDVKPTVAQLKKDVESLSQTSNSVYRYVEELSSEVTERQRINNGKGFQRSSETPP